MIEQSQQVLIEAIKASLFGSAFTYPADTDWGAVIKEAKSQTVMGLVSTVIPVHDESSDQGKAYYMQLMHEQDNLLRLLDDNSIPCVILKGCAAAVYYPKPYLRSMGDVDFLVPQDYFDNAMTIMESNGYVCTHGKNESGKLKDGARHVAYIKNGIEFELHHHFSSKGFNIDNILENAMNKREYRELNGFRFPVLPDVENGLVLLGHIHQHLMYDSLGLRQIIDWEMYYNAVINDERWNSEFAPIADEVGLLKLAVNITIMCEKYLNLPKTNLKNQNEDYAIADELLEDLMKNGNFGSKQQPSTSNSGEGIRSTICYIKRIGLFRYFQSTGLSEWRLCKKHPVLKPVAFIYGVIRFLVKGVKHLASSKNVKEQISYAKNKNVFYTKLGIKIDDFQ